MVPTRNAAPPMLLAACFLALLPACTFPPWEDRWWAGDDDADDDDTADDDTGDDDTADDDTADDDTGDDDTGDDDTADDDTADDDTADDDTADDDTADWVAMSGSTFDMGSATGDADEVPVHQVTIPAFEMWRTEVTVAQYASCVAAGSCTEADTGSPCNWNDPGYEDHPVNCVDWDQAAAFCAWVGGRLPSESEWEYAARSGGQDIEYPWGNETATCDAAVMYDSKLGWACGTGRTWSVCSKSPAGDTSQGLCDMAGNVWEWVQDWHHADYVGAPADGSAWEIPGGSIRVLRGGGIGNQADNLRTANRHGEDPFTAHYSYGFRCAR